MSLFGSLRTSVSSCFNIIQIEKQWKAILIAIAFNSFAINRIKNNIA